ncbi:hypothetical protein chiPu_0020347 [Chiloscyllium punctatum]|uniref:Uncharacterized protein n=1 Tax=Chiloscyllium punctatum TaxID=137246 RepID=A0A401REL6_CHIPU|nr:hypothetical protein [Chiloscyllium punctatum]
MCNASNQVQAFVGLKLTRLVGSADFTSHSETKCGFNSSTGGTKDQNKRRVQRENHSRIVAKKVVKKKEPLTHQGQQHE